MGKRVHTYESVKNSFEEEGYTLLSTEYKHNRAKLDYICPKGHKYSVDWNHWKDRGQRCPYCAGLNKYTMDEVRTSFENEGYILLSTEYKSNKTKLEYICDKGHRHSIIFKDWLNGVRCPYCAGNVKLGIKYIRQSFELEGYTLLSTEYINSSTKLDFICANDHRHKITWNDWRSGHRCVYCKGNNVYKDNVPLFKTYAHQIDFADSVREFIDDKGRALLAVQCKYCQEWFVPTARTVQTRIKSLTSLFAGESNFYCSQECKDSCSTYGVKMYPKGFVIDENLPYTQHELNIWSETVKAKYNYICEICGAVANDAHHIKPKKLFPNEALDPDNGIACCHECHMKYGHSGECSTGKLANTICTYNT